MTRYTIGATAEASSSGTAAPCRTRRRASSTRSLDSTRPLDGDPAPPASLATAWVVTAPVGRVSARSGL